MTPGGGPEDTTDPADTTDTADLAGLDLRPSPEAVRLRHELRAFMDAHVYPAEARVAEGADVGKALASLKREARARGLWNLCLTSASGLGNRDYAYLAEVTGRSPELAPAAINGGPPDSVNMVMLDELATPDQRERWLRPLLDDAFSSAFAMTEPDVASSDAANIATEITRDGADYVITGRKWFASAAADPRCAVLFVLGRTDPGAPPHRRHSVLAVPRDTPGVEIVRTLPVMGRAGDHAEIVFDGARVPASGLIGAEGAGFAAGQVRLGAARVQHCMRLIGLAERGLELLVRRAASRGAFGGPLSAQGLLRAQVAECRLAIDQARLLVLRTAALIDAVGARRARTEISAIKVAVLRAALLTLDRAIQVHGALGVTDDVPLARWWTHARGLHIADGPEEVHLEVLARSEFRRHRTEKPSRAPGTPGRGREEDR